jgi:hypothetical protein
MVKNFAEEIIEREVGKNWVNQFCQRYKGELKSLYLRNIDNLRIKGEYGPTYKLFYDLVACFYMLIAGPPPLLASLTVGASKCLAQASVSLRLSQNISFCLCAHQYLMSSSNELENTFDARHYI